MTCSHAAAAAAVDLVAAAVGAAGAAEVAVLTSAEAGGRRSPQWRKLFWSHAVDVATKRRRCPLIQRPSGGRQSLGKLPTPGGNNIARPGGGNIARPGGGNISRPGGGERPNAGDLANRPGGGNSIVPAAAIRPAINSIKFMNMGGSRPNARPGGNTRERSLAVHGRRGRSAVLARSSYALSPVDLCRATSPAIV